MIVGGLDLSLTSSGVARYETGLGMPELWTHAIRTKATHGVMPTAQRLDDIAATVWAYLDDADLLVIEAPSFGSKGGKAHERGGLWWLVVVDARRRGIPVATVAPRGLKLYATGNGAADKSEVVDTLLEQVGVAVRWDDEADAAVLALMGGRALGEPHIADYDGPHKTRAMSAVDWPERKAGVRT